jgi:hypothetical protein
MNSIFKTFKRNSTVRSDTRGSTIVPWMLNSPFAKVRMSSQTKCSLSRHWQARLPTQRGPAQVGFAKMSTTKESCNENQKAQLCWQICLLQTCHTTGHFVVNSPVSLACLSEISRRVVNITVAENTVLNITLLTTAIWQSSRWVRAGTLPAVWPWGHTGWTWSTGH